MCVSVCVCVCVHVHVCVCVHVHLCVCLCLCLSVTHAHVPQMCIHKHMCAGFIPLISPKSYDDNPKPQSLIRAGFVPVKITTRPQFLIYLGPPETGLGIGQLLYKVYIRVCMCVHRERERERGAMKSNPKP